MLLQAQIKVHKSKLSCHTGSTFFGMHTLPQVQSCPAALPPRHSRMLLQAQRTVQQMMALWLHSPHVQNACRHATAECSCKQILRSTTTRMNHYLHSTTAQNACCRAAATRSCKTTQGQTANATCVLLAPQPLLLLACTPMKVVMLVSLCTTMLLLSLTADACCLPHSVTR
jgi:hypothetical protein